MIRFAATAPEGLVYVHGLPGAPPSGNVSPKHALMFAAVPAVIVGETHSSICQRRDILDRCYSRRTPTALGPLYVIHANRLSGKRVLTRGSPTTAVVPSKRVKLVGHSPRGGSSD